MVKSKINVVNLNEFQDADNNKNDEQTEIK